MYSLEKNRCYDLKLHKLMEKIQLLCETKALTFATKYCSQQNVFYRQQYFLVKSLFTANFRSILYNSHGAVWVREGDSEVIASIRKQFNIRLNIKTYSACQFVG